MSLDVTLRYSKKARDQLIWLKRQTGLPHFHTICRWAFCLSLADPRPARLVQAGGDAEEMRNGEQGGTGTSFELPWERFGQRDADLLAGLLRQRAVSEGLNPTRDEVQRLAQAHIQRGLSRMMAGKKIRSISDVLVLAMNHGQTGSDSNQALKDRDTTD